MKKILLSVITLLIITGVVTSCGQKQNNLQQSAPPTQSQKPQQSGQQAVDTANFIGEDKAKEISLDRAGLTADDVIFDRLELDRDNGVWKYEVEFRQDRTEYDTEVKADDGTILSYETDYDD